MIKNKIDLYNSNKSWYDWLPERKFIILDFLPSCVGNTLDVGVHDFNKNDEICCNQNCNYETIDIDERSKNFGSSYKHTTVDFLDYNPSYKFDNILLFGVLGIYDGCGGYNYTLHNNEVKLIKKIDSLLNINGRILLGPDVNPQSGAGQNSYSTINFWNKLIKDNDIFKNKYSVIKNMIGRSNMIIVLQKKE
jgi:hypothetical protein|tara:strand:- start:3570 stop:4145 length:576 start_codon:yes stop_codon:yes gene_type:complete